MFTKKKLQIDNCIQSSELWPSNQHSGPAMYGLHYNDIWISPIVNDLRLIDSEPSRRIKKLDLFRRIMGPCLPLHYNVVIPKGTKAC